MKKWLLMFLLVGTGFTSFSATCYAWNDDREYYYTDGETHTKRVQLPSDAPSGFKREYYLVAWRFVVKGADLTVSYRTSETPNHPDGFQVSPDYNTWKAYPSTTSWYPLSSDMVSADMEWVEFNFKQARMPMYYYRIGLLQIRAYYRFLPTSLLHTVSFDLGSHGARAGGGAIEQNVVDGEGAVAPSIAVDTGWRFLGWDREFGVVTNDIVVAALYERTSCEVSFNLGEQGTRTGGGELEQLVLSGEDAVPPVFDVGKYWSFLEWDKPFEAITQNTVISAIYELSAPGDGKYSGGYGTPSAPYLIATPEDLTALGANVQDYSKSFALVKNIYLDDLSFDSALIAAEFSRSFEGDFNGRGNRIVNLTINSSDNSTVGLFGYTGEGATIRNLGIESCSINASSQTKVSALVGDHSGTIENCYVTGSVSGETWTGAIAGENEGSIINSYSFADVSAQYFYGGIAGANNGTLQYCYAVGDVSTVGMAVGGLTGLNNQLVDSCLWDTNATRQSVGDGGLGKSTAQMKQQATYTNEGWDFSDPGVWKMSESDSQFGGYPVFQPYREDVIHTVTFDLGAYGSRTGGGELIQEVLEGGNAVAPEFDLEDGWLFSGWNAGFSNVTSNITVTALYEKAFYTVTLHPGSHGRFSTANSGDDYVVQVPANDPFPDVSIVADAGYMFAGWSPVSPTTISDDFEATAQYMLKTSSKIQLLPNDGACLDGSVAASDDLVVAGAWDNPNGEGSGSAYVFDLKTGQQRHKLIPDDGAEWDMFGYRVDICGSHAVAGAWLADASGEDSGAAYVFDMNTGEQLYKLAPADGGSGDLFGYSVAISSNRVLVGAYEDDDVADASGSAYLFDVVDGSLVAKLAPEDLRLQSCFGWSVALTEKYAIVCASDQRGSGTNCVYVFDADTGVLLRTLVPEDGIVDGDAFAWSVEAHGDKAAVTACTSEHGSAYVFNLETGLQLNHFHSSDGERGDYFGNSVAIGEQYVLVQSYGGDSGKVYMFDQITGDEVQIIIPGGRVGIAGDAFVVSDYIYRFGDSSGNGSDTDNDGLPDAWEDLHGGDLDPAALCANGINTVREAYIAGLDPTNATSRLILNPVSGNALHWSAISGRVYSIWWTTNLLENFQPLETDIPWSQGGYTNPSPSPTDYYKIKVELE